MDVIKNIGRQIGRYKLLEEIGQGGMAVVYRALDTNLKREVALKLLHPHLASHRESRDRFQREAQAVARLKHPSVLEIYDYSDVEGDDVFIVMELVQGTTLRRFLDSRADEPVCPEAVALIFRQVCAALAHAHAHGIVHRDVKPENILIGPNGEIKLSDFGIAHMAGLSQMTVTGQILGSPAYMSPDHIEHAELDARADIFSIGTVLYEASVGRVPFDGKNPHAIIKRIVDCNYKSPLSLRPKVGHHMAQVIQRCLQANPDMRYQSADDLVADLDSLLSTMGIEPGDQELHRFLAEPETWWNQRRSHIIKVTLELGLSARRKRHKNTEAINHLNRVLSLEPGNDRALSALAKMSRQRRVRHILERALFLVPIIIAIAAIVWASQQQRGPQPKKHSRSIGRAPITVGRDGPKLRATPQSISVDAGAAASSGSISPERETLSVRRPASRGPAHRIRTKKREIIFTPQPMAVQIAIDGKDPFAFGPANRKRMVSVGKHTITFIPNDPARFQERTWEIDILPLEEPFQFRGRLMWHPARVLVQCDTDALITIPGRAAGKANTPFEVGIKIGPSEQVSVLISADGYIPSTKQVTITAGGLAKTKVTLVKKEN